MQTQPVQQEVPQPIFTNQQFPNAQQQGKPAPIKTYSHQSNLLNKVVSPSVQQIVTQPLNSKKNVELQTQYVTVHQDSTKIGTQAVSQQLQRAIVLPHQAQVRIQSPNQPQITASPQPRQQMVVIQNQQTQAVQRILPSILQRQRSTSSTQQVVRRNTNQISPVQQGTVGQPVQQTLQVQQVQQASQPQQVQHVQSFKEVAVPEQMQTCSQQALPHQQASLISNTYSHQNGTRSSSDSEVSSVLSEGTSPQNESVNQQPLSVISSTAGVTKILNTPTRKVVGNKRAVVPAKHVVNRGRRVTVDNQHKPAPKTPVQVQVNQRNNQQVNVVSQLKVSQQTGISTQQTPSSQPQAYLLNLTPGQSIGHQPGYRLISTAQIAKHISKVQQPSPQFQLVQQSTQQQSQQQSVKQVVNIQGPQGLQFQLHQPQGQGQPQPQIIQAQTIHQPTQVQIQMPTMSHQGQFHVQRQAQLVAQQTQVQVQQQVQLPAQPQMQQVRQQTLDQGQQFSLQQVNPTHQVVLSNQVVPQVIHQPVIQKIPNQTLKNLSNSINSQGTKVAMVKTIMQSEQMQVQSQPRGPQTYSGPRVAKAVNTGTVRIQMQHNVVTMSPDQVPGLIQQLRCPEGFYNRIVAVKRDDGTQSLIVQHVPQGLYVQPAQTVQPAPQVQVCQAKQIENAIQVQTPTPLRPEEEQITVYDAVVSETGELVFADTTSVEAESAFAAKEVTHESIDGATEHCTELEQPIDSSSASFENTESGIVKFMPGMVAVCPNCGMSSVLLNKCPRCHTTFPENVKMVPDKSANGSETIMHPGTPTLSQSFSGIVVKNLVIAAAAEKTPGKTITRSLQPLAGVIPSVDLKRKRCSQPKKTRARVPEEPEILTLSSDEEDKEENKAEKESQLLINGRSNELTAEAKALEATAFEEPDSMEETKNPAEVVEGGGMLEQAMEGSISPPFILVECRTIRIGTYKAKPCEKVVLSAQGLELKIPLPSPTGPNVTVSVALSDINRVLVSFCRTMPVIFLYLRKLGGVRVRETLQMTDSKSGYYFDPFSFDETHKRITLLPEKVTEDIKMGLKTIFSEKLMLEIQNTVANEILVKSSPSESFLRARLGLPGSEIRTIMTYPPPPARGAISINTEDYACLGEDQFLNDVIIDFYLKYLLQSVLSDEDRERTHVFSSFFYKRLTSKPKTKGRRHPIEDDPKLTPAEKRHARVKTWTKNVNLFSKDFIIMPINENCHWFLAIICFPGQDGWLRMRDNTRVDLPKPQPSTSVAAVAVAAAAAATITHSKLKVKDNVMSIGSTTITPVKATSSATITLDHNPDDGSDRDEAEGDEEEMEENTSDDEDTGNAEAEANGSKVEEGSTETEAVSDTPVTPTNVSAEVKKGKPISREEVKLPCILIFDSLVGAPRYRVVATLRDYLSIEFKAKEGKVKEFTKDTIKGMLPKVPQQTNFTDCGLYLLQYVEMFFKDPIRDYHPPIKQLVDWFPEEVVSRKREEIVHLLHDLMKEQNIDPQTLSLPQLTFNNFTSAQVKARQQAEDEEACARLAEADSEVQKALESQMTGGVVESESVPPVQYSKVEPMDEDVDCQSAEVVLQSSGDTANPSEDQSDSLNISENNDENTVTHSCELNNGNGSSVAATESSDDCTNENSLHKRTQCEGGDEETVDRKKRRAN